MLILARKTGQSIIFGEDVEITVIEVRGEQVRLGITAPKSLPIYRKELLEQVKAANIDAAAATPESFETLLGKSKNSAKPETEPSNNSASNDGN